MGQVDGLSEQIVADLRPELIEALNAVGRADIPQKLLPLIEQSRWLANWILELGDPRVLEPSLSEGLRKLLEREILPLIPDELRETSELYELVAFQLDQDGLTGSAAFFRGNMP